MTDSRSSSGTTTAAEIQSGMDRQKWAENLILQLPVTHDGRNSWLLNYGRGEFAQTLRRDRELLFNEQSQAVNPPARPGGVAQAAPDALRAAAERVCWFDWSDNDMDAVAAIDALRKALMVSSTDRATTDRNLAESRCEDCPAPRCIVCPVTSTHQQDAAK